MCAAEVEWSRKGNFFCQHVALEGEEFCKRHMKMAESQRAYRSLIKSLVDEAMRMLDGEGKPSATAD